LINFFYVLVGRLSGFISLLRPLEFEPARMGCYLIKIIQLIISHEPLLFQDYHLGFLDEFHQPVFSKRILFQFIQSIFCLLFCRHKSHSTLRTLQDYPGSLLSFPDPFQGLSSLCIQCNLPTTVIQRNVACFGYAATSR